MSSDSFIAYCGLRFDVSSGEEEDVELRNDHRTTKSKKFGLRIHYGRFGEGQEKSFLLVGSSLGTFGVENLSEASFSLVEMQEVFFKTQTKLLEAGFEGKPAFHLILEPDF